VADGIDATVDQMKAANGQPVVDCAACEPEPNEPPARDDAMLPRRERRERRERSPARPVGQHRHRPYSGRESI
jgi:hypothetical protein